MDDLDKLTESEFLTFLEKTNFEFYNNIDVPVIIINDLYDYFVNNAEYFTFEQGEVIDKEFWNLGSGS